MQKILMIFLGGGIGSALRYIVKIFCDKHFGYLFPWGTFAVNILGCIFLGFVFALAIHKSDFLDTNTRLFLTVGIAGGFTTFSTFSLEAVNLITEGHLLISLGYMLSSVIFGLLSIYLGFYIAKYV
jgi:CrcB protein